MAAAYRASVSLFVGNTFAGNNTTAINKPAGTVSGDLLILTVGGYSATGTFTWPSGFTQGASQWLTGPDGERLAWAWKLAGGSEPSTYAIGVNTETLYDGIVTISAFSGVDQTTPVTASQVSSSTASNSSPISIGLTGLTAAEGDCLVVISATDQITATDRWGWTPPTGFTEREEVSTHDWTSHTLATKDNVTAGATGIVTITATRSTGTSEAGWLGFLIAINAATGSGNNQTLGISLDNIASAVSQTLNHSQSIVAGLDDVTVTVNQSKSGAKSQQLNITLDSITAAASQTVNHSQTLAATLDSITVEAAQVAQHSQLIASSLDDVAIVVSQSKSGSIAQSLAVNLDSIEFSASQVVAHSQSTAIILDGIIASVVQSVTSSEKNQTLVISLDDVTLSFAQSRIYSQALGFILDDIAFSINQTSTIPVQYPLAGINRTYELAGIEQQYPLAGIERTYP